MWADLKNYIRQKCPKTQYDLAKCVRKFEKKLTPEYCKKYADHVRNVIQTVIYPVFSLNEYLTSDLLCSLKHLPSPPFFRQGPSSTSNFSEILGLADPTKPSDLGT